MSSSFTERALRETFERYGARGPNERGDYQLNCPFCEEREGKKDEKYKLSANPLAQHPTDPTVKGGWVCWRCDVRGWGGIDFLEVPDVRPPEAVDLGPPFGFASFKENESALSLNPYRQYVRGRKDGAYVLEILTRIGGGACLTGWFEGRVLVPHVVNGKWEGFSARTIGKGDPKYLYPRGMDRRRGLWGVEWLPPDDQPAWIVEGVFDALPLWPYGVATFGKSVTQEQIEQLAALERPLVVCLDGDAWTEGYALAARLAMRRAVRPGPLRVQWARLPPTTDPGSLGWDVKKHVMQQ